LAYTFHGQIWRILPDPEFPSLIVEIRQAETRQVTFAAINLSLNQLLWQQYSPVSSWWVTAMNISGGLLFLQTYVESGQVSQAQGIIAVDINTQQLLWQKEQVSFLQMSPQGIIASEKKEELPEFYLLDKYTGKSLAVIAADQLADWQPEVGTKKNLLSPTHYSQDNGYFDKIAQFLSARIGVQAVQAVDYAEFKKLILISYYIYAENQLANFLVIFDEQSHILLHEPIASNADGIGVDTFYIVYNHLIFIKNKTELLGYEL
jgi:hypothetical protein